MKKKLLKSSHLNGFTLEFHAETKINFRSIFSFYK